MTDQYFLAGYRAQQGVKLGLQKDETLYAIDEAAIPSLDWLLQNVPAADLLARLEGAMGAALPDDTPRSLRGLLNRQPVWGAGVTYKISEEARERESKGSTIYTRVYSAERPEVFWKAMGFEAISNGDAAGIRCDATWSVPEPELTVVFNARMEVVGFTAGNDMSSRDIEGANPLYLPQAKVYDDACALGPRIWLQPGITAWPDVSIQIQIERGGTAAFSGTTSTEKLHRTLPELAATMSRCKRFPDGALLMTGTGVVPPDTFTLQAGDVVRITMEPIGELVNPVHVIGVCS